MPGTIASIVFLLLVATPGIIVELLRQRYRPARADSTFVETARVTAAGVVLGGIALMLLGLIETLSDGAVVDFRRLLLEPTYLPDNLWFTGASAALFVTISTNLGFLYFSVFQYPGSPVVAAESGWATVFGRLEDELKRQVAVELPGKKLVTQVQVMLKDGTGWIGIREAYSVDIDPKLREIVLSNPLIRINSDGFQTELDGGWRRIVIAGENIVSTAARFSTTDGSNSVDRKVIRASGADRWRERIFQKPYILIVVLGFQLLTPLIINQLHVR